MSDYKKDFPIFTRYPDLTYLDNAATAQTPQVVIDAMTQYYTTANANVHRGLYTLSETATTQYELARDSVQTFIGAAEREEIIFTSGTTASINLVAYTFCVGLTANDVILVSPLEHHSNLVPWQIITQRTGAQLVFLDAHPDGTLNLATLEKKLTSNVKLVAVSHISNAIGSVHDIKTIIQQAHNKNIPVLIDAAQSVPHMSVHVQELDCDFLAFSGHKMCGPTGVGVLYGKRKLLEQLPPFMGGGDMIREVSLQSSTWNDLPYKFEAGTPNISGVIGLGTAVDYVQSIGMDTIYALTHDVYDYLYTQLTQLDFVEIFGPKDFTQRHSIISFNVRGVHPHDVAHLLNEDNIAVRAGHHCAQPVMQLWKVPATVRASVYFYNTLQDVDKLITGLKKVYNKFIK